MHEITYNEMFVMFFIHKDRKRRAVSFSAIDNQRIELFPEYMSLHGVIFGGVILDIVDEYVKKVAEKHSDVKCEISAINCIRFFSQIKRDDILVCRASVNRVWDKSLEVGVKVIAEDFRSLDKRHVFSAYFTFEGILEDNKFLPFLFVENKEQKRRYVDAQKRKDKIHKVQKVFSDNLNS
jgi:acyl-CoA hydrolase